MNILRPLVLIIAIFLVSGCMQDDLLPPMFLNSEEQGFGQASDGLPAGEESQQVSIPEEDRSTAMDDQPNADVIYVRAVLLQDGTWTFHVTVTHPDTGWEDYADGWDVVTPDGVVLKINQDDPFTRLLLHPHENEQPFTRSQQGIIIPTGTKWIRVRAHDLVAGFGGVEIMVDITQESGPGYEVER